MRMRRQLPQDLYSFVRPQTPHYIPSGHPFSKVFLLVLRHNIRLADKIDGGRRSRTKLLDKLGLSTLSREISARRSAARALGCRRRRLPQTTAAIAAARTILCTLSPTRLQAGRAALPQRSADVSRPAALWCRPRLPPRLVLQIDA